MFVFKGLLEKHKLDSREFKANPGYVMINNIRSVPTYDVKIKTESLLFPFMLKSMLVFKKYRNKLT